MTQTRFPLYVLAQLLVVGVSATLVGAQGIAPPVPSASGEAQPPVQTATPPRPATAPIATPPSAPVGTSGSSPAAPVSAPPSTSLLVNEYQLQPGDKLRIDVYKDDQLSQSVQIRPDGKVTMPLVGDLMASGLTPVALRDRVAAALQDYVNHPVVTVVVIEATSPIAYVAGEVNRPGTITMQRRVTVLQALALVGGLKDFANTKGIYILRGAETGRSQKIPYNYKSALKGDTDEVYLLPGDTLVVP